MDQSLWIWKACFFVFLLLGYEGLFLFCLALDLGIIDGLVDNKDLASQTLQIKPDPHCRTGAHCI